MHRESMRSIYMYLFFQFSVRLRCTQSKMYLQKSHKHKKHSHPTPSVRQMTSYSDNYGDCAKTTYRICFSRSCNMQSSRFIKPAWLAPIISNIKSFRKFKEFSNFLVVKQWSILQCHCSATVILATPPPPPIHKKEILSIICSLA